MNKKIIFVAILVSLLLVLASLAEGKKRGLRLGGKIKAAAKNVVSTVENTAKKAIDVATGIIKTVQGQDIVGTLPAVGKSVEKPVCPNNGVFGPSNVNGEKATEYKEQMQQKGCRFCTVDCAAIWSFAEQYESKWFDDFVKNPSKRPDLYVVEASTCKCRYYNYGCQLNTHCASYDSFDEMLTAISFCMIHNGCKFNSKIHNDATMRDFVSKFSQVGDIIMKPNTKLMTHETKVLQQMDARAGVIYHYKRVQDIRDFVMLSKSFEDYTNSSANWQLDQLPSYLYSAISAHPVTQKLYERVAYKINVLKYLPEDDVLMKVRQQAQRQIQLEDRVSELYGKLKSGWNPFEKIEAAYDLANAYYDLLMNEIESLRLGAYLTLESAEQEEIHKKEIEKKAAERVAAAGERAELALFQLFLGGSFGMKMEAVKKLFKLLGKELQAKVMVHINKIAGKVSDAALLAIANAKNGALHAAREITGAANAAAYAAREGLQKAGNEIAKHTTKYGGIAIDNVKNVGKKAVNKVKNFGKKSINRVKNFGKKAISKIGGGFRSFGRKLGGGFRKIGGGFRKIGGGFRSFGRKLGGGFRKISGGFRKIGGGFRSFGRKLGGGFRKISGGFRSVGRKIGGGFRKIGGGFRSVGRKIGGGFRSAGRKLRRFFRRW